MEDPGDRKIDKHHAHTTLSVIEQFYTGGKYSDVQLRVGTKLFKCQRLLLASNSEYFDTMFSSNFEESNAGADQPITLHEMDVIAFEEILHFMYTGEIRVNDTNVFQLLFVADFLRLRRVTYIKEQCVEHLEARGRSRESKPIPDALELFSFACLKADKLLVDILSTHICQHLRHYSNDEQLMNIDFEGLHSLVKFSKDYILPLRGAHDVILKIILNWINHNRKERKKHRCQLMENIDYSYISSNYISLIMDRLENVADEVLNLPEDINSALEEMKTLKMRVKIGQTNGNNRLSNTISLDINNVSKMEVNKDVFSSSLIISNLLWKFYVRRSNTNMLEVNLCCDGPPTYLEWYCFARVKFTILSQKKTKKSFSTSFDSVKFSAINYDLSSFVFDDVIRWSDLVDPKNGFMKDDTITIHAHVNADIPFCPRKEDRYWVGGFEPITFDEPELNFNGITIKHFEF